MLGFVSLGFDYSHVPHKVGWDFPYPWISSLGGEKLKPLWMRQQKY